MEKVSANRKQQKGRKRNFVYNHWIEDNNVIIFFFMSSLKTCSYTNCLLV